MLLGSCQYSQLVLTPPNHTTFSHLPILLLSTFLLWDPLLAARSSWAALLVPHLYVTGSTSGGSFSMGCTSGAPSLQDEIHFWWLVLHELHFWCPISTWDGGSYLMGCTSGAPPLHGFTFSDSISIGSIHSDSYFTGSLMVACWYMHSWDFYSRYLYPGQLPWFQYIYIICLLLSMGPFCALSLY